MTMKTFKGSCHCGNVRFEADIDLSKGTGRCNCSYCGKTRSWGVLLKPEAFRLLTGEDELTSYRMFHKFCKTSGVRTHALGEIPALGPFASINIAALDDASVDELMSGPLRFADGKHDKWQDTPADTRHL